MADTSDERALATWLSALDADELTTLLARRGVSPSAAWHDFFDAAAGLLEAGSIDRALVGLARDEAVALGDAVAHEEGPSVAHEEAAAGHERDALIALALVRTDGRPYRAVAVRARMAATQQPGAFTAAEPEQAPAAADESGEAAAAEHALSAIGALTDVVALTRDVVLATTAAGLISAADRRRLVEGGIVGDGDELDDLLAVAEAARLMTTVGREWRVTGRGEEWVRGPAAQRWETAVRALVGALPAGLRRGAGFAPPGTWPDAYPLDPAWPGRAAVLVRRMRRWGLLAPDGAEPPWTRTMREGGTPATGTLRRRLPAEIDRIYLQADLTAIAPGPLLSALDLRLRGMAERESRAQASTYRFSAESVSAAVAGGETAESIREFLLGLSLTGIPQPLDYLIDRTTERHGTVRVRADAASGRTRVESDDAQLLRTIAVDQALRSIGLVETDDGLASRVSRDAVFWSLADARYPVVALDAAGEVEPLRRRRPALADADPTEPAAHAQLVRTLLDSGESDTDIAWRERELEQAVRNRAVIAVSVRLPDGTTREFVLEAKGLGGGRLRGRDRAADTERTLPISSIVSVHPA